MTVYCTVPLVTECRKSNTWLVRCKFEKHNCYLCICCKMTISTNTPSSHIACDSQSTPHCILPLSIHPLCYVRRTPVRCRDLLSDSPSIRGLSAFGFARSLTNLKKIVSPEADRAFRKWHCINPRMGTVRRPFPPHYSVHPFTIDNAHRCADCTAFALDIARFRTISAQSLDGFTPGSPRDLRT